MRLSDRTSEKRERRMMVTSAARARERGAMPRATGEEAGVGYHFRPRRH